jgi:hypothetical protein
MAMKEWHKTHPELFKKRPYNHTGLDTYTLFGAHIYLTIGCFHFLDSVDVKNG